MKQFLLLNVLIASVSSLSTLCSAQQTVSVGIVDNISQDTGSVGNILKEGSRKLMLDPGKRECGLKSELKGKRLLKLDAQMGAIHGPADVSKICKVGGTLNIVNFIDQCYEREPLNNIKGCFIEGCAVLVLDDDKVENESLFLHEYAHTKGLPHVCADDYLMSPTLSSGQFTVSKDECDQIKGLASDDEILLPETQLSEAEPVTAESIVKKHYLHGLPLALVRRLPLSEVSDLRKLLNEEKTEDFKANAILAIGLVGDERDEQVIISVLNSTTKERRNLEPTTLVAPLALSYLQHRGHLSKSGIAMLQKRVDPLEWNKEQFTDPQAKELAASTIRAVSNLVNPGFKVETFLNSLLSRQDDFFRSKATQQLVHLSIQFNIVVLPQIPL
jgi:hypothetical protein